jgi:hypothetical protein
MWEPHATFDVAVGIAGEEELAFAVDMTLM